MNSKLLKYINWEPKIRPVFVLFKSPVEKIFEWIEEDYQGFIVVIYAYCNKYITVTDNFGTCELCDEWMEYECGKNSVKANYIKKIFNSIEIFETKEKVIDSLLNDYSHPELKEKLQSLK